MMSRRKNRISRTREDIIFDTVNTFFLLCVLFLTLYPFYHVLILSLNEGLDAVRGGIYFWPRKWSLENFQSLLGDPKWAKSLLISVSRTLIGTVGTVGFTALVAYGMSFKELVFRKWYYAVIILAMYFHGGMIPTFALYRSIKILNTFWVYVAPALLNTFFMMVMISFFQDIPISLIEVARLDGASEITIFRKIILPLSLPILATTALFVGVGQWNSWIDSAYYVSSKELRTMSYLMMEIINKSMIDRLGSGAAAGIEVSQQTLANSSTAVTTRSIQMAAMIVSVAPIICVYPFLQKYFVKGIMLGSVKG